MLGMLLRVETARCRMLEEEQYISDKNTWQILLGYFLIYFT